MRIEKDITTILLSEADILPELMAVFPESIIINTEFRIVAAGRWMEEILGYTSAELTNRTLDILQLGLEITIREKLVAGYFEEGDFTLLSKSKKEVMTDISGFYLGIFADVNNYIILRLINPRYEKSNEVHHKISDDFDQFVYNAAHSLRGPLATIKGLINLARISDRQKELEYVLDQLGIFSEKLDDKLHKLILFAESDTLYQEPPHAVNKFTLEQRLRKMIQETSMNNPIEFEFNYQENGQCFPNETRLNSLLFSFILFVLSLERMKDAQLKVQLLLSEYVTNVVIGVTGFRFEEEHTSILTNNDYGYASLLKHPELIKCYIAQRNISKMDGSIDLKFLSAIDQVVLISVPTEQSDR